MKWSDFRLARTMTGVLFKTGCALILILAVSSMAGTHIHWDLLPEMTGIFAKLCAVLILIAGAIDCGQWHNQKPKFKRRDGLLDWAQEFIERGSDPEDRM